MEDMDASCLQGLPLLPRKRRAEPGLLAPQQKRSSSVIFRTQDEFSEYDSLGHLLFLSCQLGLLLHTLPLEILKGLGQERLLSFLNFRSLPDGRENFISSVEVLLGS